MSQSISLYEQFCTMSQMRSSSIESSDHHQSINRQRISMSKSMSFDESVMSQSDESYRLDETKSISQWVVMSQWWESRLIANVIVMLSSMLSSSWVSDELGQFCIRKVHSVVLYQSRSTYLMQWWWAWDEWPDAQTMSGYEFPVRMSRSCSCSTRLPCRAAAQMIVHRPVRKEQDEPRWVMRCRASSMSWCRPSSCRWAGPSVDRGWVIECSSSSWAMLWVIICNNEFIIVISMSSVLWVISRMSWIKGWAQMNLRWSTQLVVLWVHESINESVVCHQCRVWMM